MQPFLIVYGEEDGLVPMEDARKEFETAGPKDKHLRVFGSEEGSCEHVGADDIDPVRQLAVDWFAQRLGTAGRGISGRNQMFTAQ
jgi:esterase/lipase